MQSIAVFAPLYGAKEMLALGLKAKEPVVRFLILYSAMMLVALFRNSADGTQQEVDKLLRDVNPGLRQVTRPPRKKAKKKPTSDKETFYTKLRNDFVHAEERGWKPMDAVKAIEEHIAEFQRDVEEVFNRL